MVIDTGATIMKEADEDEKVIGPRRSSRFPQSHRDGSEYRKIS